MTDNLSGAINSHENKNNKIALTFDDGPHGKYTKKILDILKKYEVPATFFVVGENAVKYPELIKRELAEGHEIGNHTFYHPHLNGIKSSVFLRELVETENAIYETSDYKTKLFRPPEGKCSDRIEKITSCLDYRIILWSVDTRDWAHSPVNVIVDNIKKNIKSGDIILFHDFICGKSPTPEALEIIIPYLKSQGYNFVTVSELIMSD